MSVWRSLAHGVCVLTRRRAADRELDEELAHFLDESAAEHRAKGMSEADAARAARREIGDPIRAREQVRDGGWEHGVATVLADLRLASRMLRQSPVFTLVVVAVIALGSGAVTTVFSAMNALVLRPVPGVESPATLVSLRPARRDGSADEQTGYPLYRQIRERTTTLASVAVWGRVALTISTGGAGVAVQGNMVSEGYFSTLGVRPAAGRFFSPDEVQAPGAAPVLVVSDRFWHEQLDRRPDAVGQAVTVNGHPFTIIGIAPAGFHGIYTGLVADAWVPVTMQPQLRPRSSLAGGSWTWMFGRLRPDIASGAAEAEISTIVAGDDTGDKRPDAYVAMRMAPLTGLPGGERAGVLQFLTLLLGASALVLLIAGVNVATMLSARHLSRAREMAVRAALGAGRARLVGHLLTEVLVLFMLGALGGYGVAVAATAALERLPLPASVPVTLELSPDLRVLGFTLLVSLLAGVLFGVGPSFGAARRDITTRLREESAGAGGRRGRLSRALIAGQLACSLVLLVAASLFLRALDAGGRVEPGFDREDVTVVWLEPEAWGYDETRARAFYAGLDRRARGLPGVEAVAAAGRLPLMMSSSIDEIADGKTTLRAHSAVVGPEYFDVLRLPLAAGRAFTPADGPEAARVVIVNQELATRLWPGGDAIGRTFRFRGDLRTVVGVARNAKYASLSEPLPPFAYFPIAQVWQPTQALLVRTAPGVSAATVLQQAVLDIDPQLPPPRVTTLSRATGIVLLPQRAAAVVTAGLGGVGLILAAVGLYGAMAFSTGRRTREIGIRVALGASRASVLSMVLGEGLRLSLAGVAAGLLLAAAATRLLTPWLFGVDPLDVSAFAAMTAALLLVATLASYVPARRAARVDPLVSLRAE